MEKDEESAIKKAQLHAKLLKRFHTVCAKNGLTEMEKKTIEESFGCESSKDMTSLALVTATQMLEKQSQANENPTDKWRKRCIAAVYGFYRKREKEVSIDYVKGTIVKQSGYLAFNDIPTARLSAIYNYWLNAQQIEQMGDKVIAENELTLPDNPKVREQLKKNINKKEKA